MTLPYGEGGPAKPVGEVKILVQIYSFLTGIIHRIYIKVGAKKNEYTFFPAPSFYHLIIEL